MSIQSVVLLTCQKSHPMCITPASSKVGSTAFYIKKIAEMASVLVTLQTSAMKMSRVFTNSEVMEASS